jgi:hypothetical protein
MWVCKGIWELTAKSPRSPKVFSRERFMKHAFDPSDENGFAPLRLCGSTSAYFQGSYPCKTNTPQRYENKRCIFTVQFPSVSALCEPALKEALGNGRRTP